jgi:hypothetical protein
MNVNNQTYCIGIMTYSKRKEYVTTLIEDIRKQSTITIYLAVNCDYNEEFDDDYREYILNLCLQHKNIYPSFYLKFRGCAKIWNDIVINSCYDNCLILNDDCRILNNFINDIIQFKISNNINTIVKTNKCWSSFLVNKNYLTEVGFFNEYYIGIGFEDSEFIRRLGEYTSYITTDWISLTEQSKQTFPGNETLLDDDAKQYSSFNHRLFHSGFIGSDENFRPYEKYYMDNYNQIFL